MRMLRKAMVLLGLLGLTMIMAGRVHAIRHCHDFIAWAITGQDVNGTPHDRLRQILRAQGYEIAFTSTAAAAGTQSRLQTRDVLIFGNAHSAMVNGRGTVDHFLQDPAQIGRDYLPNELSSLPNYFAGPTSWTLDQFANHSRDIPPTTVSMPGTVNSGVSRIYPFRNAPLEVWRKARSARPAGTWEVTATYQGYTDDLRWDFGMGIKRTLLSTTNPTRKQYENRSWSDATLGAQKDGRWRYDQGRGSFWATAMCTFGDSWFSCDGKEVNGMTEYPLAIQGRQSGAQGWVTVPPGGAAPAANTVSGGVAVDEFLRYDNKTIGSTARTLRAFGSPTEQACRAACAKDQDCVAFTFVRQGGYAAGDPSVCYLMASFAPGVEHSCCVSGVKTTIKN